MALLDGDRFEGRFRDGVHTADVSDLMHRMTKESLLKFDATPLFPERIAHTVPYQLSDAEDALYTAVTDYVREEFVTHVPAPVRTRDRLIGVGEPVQPRYERVVFEKTLMTPPGEVPAAFIFPGHPLLDSVIDLTIERNRDLLRRGAILVDDRDCGVSPRMLFFLEHAIQDASVTRTGERRVVSQRMLYVEIDASGAARHLQCAAPRLPGIKR